MQALRFYPPGDVEKLKLLKEAIPGTDLKSNELLIKVHAVGLIWPELTWPIYQKSDGSYRDVIPGRDFSGVVMRTGTGVSMSLRSGTHIMAFTSRHNHEGAMAEYAVADMDQVIPMPTNLTFVEAAAVPLSALTAYQALFQYGKIQKGQRVLITAGAGGTGVFAVQFAKHFGVHIIATGSSDESRKLLHGLGVDQFVDYGSEEMHSAIKEPVDLLLDCVGGKSGRDALQVVRRDGGSVISIVDPECERLAHGKGVKGFFFIVKMDSEQLKQVSVWIEEGFVRPIIDKVVSLEQAAEAFRDAALGHVHGKIVIQICHDDT